jgi:multidrug resistance efflux pump
VRAYVVTIAPEVAGRIIELPVVDNKYVHKGDLLMVIDPTDYRIAVRQAEAAMQQAEASGQNVDAQMDVQQAQRTANQALLDQAQAALVFAQQQAERYQTLAKEGSGSVQNAQQYTSQLHERESEVHTAQEKLKLAERQVASLKVQRASAEANLTQTKAQLHQAQVHLERTRILSPVNGYVTNLLAQLGDYVNVGVNTISVVNADSFWVDGYFEETNLAAIRVDDSARSSSWATVRSYAAMSIASPAPSPFRTRSPTIRGSPRLTPFSLGCALRSASRSASISMRCRRTSSCLPA